MNAAYFILISALLAFATGFFVAAIIWVIRFLLSASEEKSIQSGLKLFWKNLSLPRQLSHADQVIKENKSFSFNPESINKELYHYYHGEN